MKKYLKVVFAALTVLMLVSSLAACGPSGSHSSIDYFEDEERHVRVMLEDGQASITFNVKRWNETYGLQNDGHYAIPDDLQDVFFPIIPRDGNVVDVRVARVFSMGSHLVDDSELPVVALLMDDGSIEWCYADPNSTLYYVEFSSSDMYSIGTNEKIVRKYSGDFVSIDCVSSDEDSAYKTIYAVSSYGYRFDFQKMHLENQLFDNGWICELQGGSLYGYLSVEEDYHASFSISDTKYADWSSSDLQLLWTGMAHYVTSPDDDLPLGTITFDMEPATESPVAGQELSPDMAGHYLADITFDQDYQMTLYHTDGDKLYPSSDEVLVFKSWFYAIRDVSE